MGVDWVDLRRCRWIAYNPLRKLVMADQTMNERDVRWAGHRNGLDPTAIELTSVLYREQPQLIRCGTKVPCSTAFLALTVPVVVPFSEL
jgi:hypothetical protein